MHQLFSLAGSVSDGFQICEKDMLGISGTPLQSEVTHGQVTVPGDVAPWFCWISGRMDLSVLRCTTGFSAKEPSC